MIFSFDQKQEVTLIPSVYRELNTTDVNVSQINKVHYFKLIYPSNYIKNMIMTQIILKNKVVGYGWSFL